MWIFMEYQVRKLSRNRQGGALSVQGLHDQLVRSSGELIVVIPRNPQIPQRL